MRMASGSVLVLATVMVVIALSTAVAVAGPSYKLNVTGFERNYAPGEPLRGTLNLTFDEYPPSNSILQSRINGNDLGSIGVSGIIQGPEAYSFVEDPFSYTVTMNGQNTWGEFPEQDFYYSIRAEGECGNPDQCCDLDADPPTCRCDCAGYCGDIDEPSSFPCNWEVSYPQGWKFGSVKGDQGLVLVDDFTNIGRPGSEILSRTVWEETSNSDSQYAYRNPNVTLIMRMACGGEDYGGKPILSNGWIFQRELGTDTGGWVMEGVHARTSIFPFDNSSLLQNRGLLSSSPIGGIYRNDLLMQYSEVAQVNSAYWNGSSGEIKIYYYDDDSTYKITYLPPNGPLLCAYTNISTGGSESWTSQGTYNGGIRYNGDYNRTFQKSSLPKEPCPAGSENCQQEVTGFSVQKESDPGGLVTVRGEYNQSAGNFTVFAETATMSLTRNQSATVGLEQFSGLAASGTGSHIFGIQLKNGAAVLQGFTDSFVVCDDRDGDGYCSKDDGGQDCDDTVNGEDTIPGTDDDGANINPGQSELCNGIDDDCDGEVDEGFLVNGVEMGSICGGAPNTACTGTWVCTDGGQNATCFQRYQPGELLEVCDNGIDDDCDGEIDEFVDLQGNAACWCSLGQTRQCGSNIGICSQGTTVCELSDDGRPQWRECRGDVSPETESCNRQDDDCDGIIDNVAGGTSAASSSCGCFGNALPSPEECNDIDDDCDGEIDEGISCCNSGDTRPCGTDVGACSMGTETCVDGSWQGLTCEGAVEPMGEVCYNNEDDDCDGEIDEGCDISYTCNNGLQDLNEDGLDCGGPCPRGCISGSFWMIAAGVMILALIGIWAMVLRKKS